MSRNMSQLDLANALGCGQSTIAMWETGNRIPDIDTIDYIADVFNVSPYSILYSDQEVGSMIKASQSEDAIWAKREALRRDPKRRLLFDLAENGSEKDIDAAVALLDALKATNPDFYDGDEPS